MPDTLGGAGVCFTPKDLEFAAELLGELAYNDDLRARVIAGQRRRLDDFGAERAARRRRSVHVASSRLVTLKCGLLSSCNATAPRSSAGRNTIAASSPSGSRRATKSRCSRRARAITSPGKTNTRKAPIASTASAFGDLPCAHTRDIQAFNQYSDWIFQNPHTREDELKWLEMQGPWCPALLDYLDRHHNSYDALIFFTYLYAPTVLGLQIDPQRSILVPTAHDEPAIHLDIYKEMFRLPAAIAYNTEVEKNFLKTTFDIRTMAEETVGCGVDLMQGDVGEGEPPTA